MAFHGVRRGIAFVALVGCARPAFAQGALSVMRGVESLSRRDLPAAMRNFSRAVDDSNPVIRSTAERWLGHLSWKAFADANAASAHLDRALIGIGDSSPVLLERARLLAFQHRYRQGTRIAADVMQRSPDAERRGLAARTLVEIAVNGAFAAVAAKAPVVDSIETPAISIALDSLRSRVDRFPGRSVDASALINAGVLALDARAVRAGWRSYYLLADDSTRAALDEARRSIDAAVPSGPARSGSTDDEQWALANGLAASRLYEPAALLLERLRQKSGSLSPAQSDIRVYGAFIHDLRIAVSEVYRRTLTGTIRDGDLDRAIHTRSRVLWTSLQWHKPPPPYYPSEVAGELAVRFHAVVNIERGYHASQLQFAHVVASFLLPNPADRSPRRFVILDGVVSNGMDQWLLEGANGRAGWVSGDSIFEVRTAFTERPFLSWITMTDPRAAAIERGRLARDSAGDIGRALADSTSYLPGVAARMFRDGSRPIIDSLSRTALSPTEQQAAFVDILFKQLTETTIALHETRHLIDARRHGHDVTGADAEFRAKIDEVSGATRPRLALTAILHPNIGDPSPHGRANRRVMLGLIRWIRANATSVAAYDPSMPPLVELPLLTDAQLRDAFRSMGAVR